MHQLDSLSGDTKAHTLCLMRIKHTYAHAFAADYCLQTNPCLLLTRWAPAHSLCRALSTCKDAPHQIAFVKMHHTRLGEIARERLSQEVMRLECSTFEISAHIMLLGCLHQRTTLCATRRYQRTAVQHSFPIEHLVVTLNTWSHEHLVT